MVKRQETACVGLSTLLADSLAIVDLARARADRIHIVEYCTYTANRVRCFRSHGDMGRLVTLVKPLTRVPTALPKPSPLAFPEA